MEMEEHSNLSSSTPTSSQITADRNRSSPSEGGKTGGSRGSTISPSPTNSASPPKKSARLAEKRKLREEAGPSEDDYYFTPFKFAKSSNSVSPPPTRSNNNDSPSKIMLNRSLKGGSASPSSFLSPSKLASKTSSLSSHSPAVSSSSSSGSGGSNSATKLEDKKIPQEPSANFSRESSSEDEKWSDAVVRVVPDSSGNISKNSNTNEVADGYESSSKLLTARQKSLLHKNSPNYVSPAIDSICNSKPEVMTQEMIRIRAEKCERRRQLAQQKKEHDKKKTIDRLLKKQQTKILRPHFKLKLNLKSNEPKISYVIGRDLNTISFPTGFELPILGKGMTNLVATKQVMCGVEGCSQPKRYNCSKTNVPLCSLECYKKNLAVKTNSTEQSTCNIYLI